MDQVSISATERDTHSTTPLSLSPRGILRESANTWQISDRAMLLIWAVPVLILMAGVVSGLFGKATYKAFTGEDQIAENIQVILWAITFGFTLYIGKTMLLDKEIVMAVMYFALAAGMFFIIGEELSWGQRIFGWSTPDSMKVINKQDETNIHNIHGVGTTFKWLHLIMGAYGTLAPIILLRMKKLAPWRARLSMVVPHFSLIPFFVIPLLWRVYRNLFEPPQKYYFAVSEFSEVIETVIAAAFVFFMIFQVRQLKLQKRLSSSNNHRSK